MSTQMQIKKTWHPRDVLALVATLLFFGTMAYTAFHHPKPQWVERNGQPCVVYNSHVWCRPMSEGAKHG